MSNFFYVFFFEFSMCSAKKIAPSTTEIIIFVGHPPSLMITASFHTTSRKGRVLPRAVQAWDPAPTNGN